MEIGHRKPTDTRTGEQKFNSRAKKPDIEPRSGSYKETLFVNWSNWKLSRPDRGLNKSARVQKIEVGFTRQATSYSTEINGRHKICSKNIVMTRSIVKSRFEYRFHASQIWLSIIASWVTRRIPKWSFSRFLSIRWYCDTASVTSGKTLLCSHISTGDWVLYLTSW